MPSDRRLLGADFVRAAACLTVLIHHLAQRMSPNHDFGLIDGVRAFSVIGTFGVAMFFVLSGFLLARPFWLALDAGSPMPSLAVYAKRRAARILPGYWLALVVTFVLSITVFSIPLDGQLVVRLLAGLFLIADWHWVTFFPVEINGPLWSICFEITSYILLPLGLTALFATRDRIGRTGTRVLWAGVIALALGAHLLFMRYYPIDNVQRTWDFGLIGGAKFWMPRYNPSAFFVMFAVGSLAAGLQVVAARHRHWLFDLLSLALLTAAVWRLWIQAQGSDGSGFGWLDVPYGFPWFVLAIAAILVVTPSSVVVGRMLDNGLVRYLARISFGIYVWHYVVLELVRRFWMPELVYGGMTDTGRFVLASGVITVVTCIVAHVSYYRFELPFIRWAQGPARSTTTPALSPAAT